MLPYHGTMTFDSADLSWLESSGYLLDVITHEMGHVIGIGTIWSSKGLLSGAGTSDPEFTGAKATAEYDAIFGSTAHSVPVENTGGSGTANVHWRESVFANELMTGFYNAGSVNPISRITAASLADLGYQVDMNGAESYTPPGGLVIGGGGGSGGGGGGTGHLLFGGPDFGDAKSTLPSPVIGRVSATGPIETSVSDGSAAKAADYDRMLNWFTSQSSQLTPDSEATVIDGTADSANSKPIDPIADPVKAF
jgi:hypothetical protein